MGKTTTLFIKFLIVNTKIIDSPKPELFSKSLKQEIIKK